MTNPNQYLLDRMPGRDTHLRAADADRERIAERLRLSHAEGRLDMDEFQQRLERCYGAKTFGELRELVRDLPRSDEPDRRRSAGSFGWGAVALAPILFVLLVVLAAASHHGFWLWIPILFLFWRMSRRRGRRWAGPRRGPGDWI